MRMKFSFTIFLLPLLILGSFASAQVKLSDIWFRTSGFEVDLEGLVYKQGEELIPVHVENQVLSPFYQYNGDSKLEFYRVLTDPLGKETLEVLGTFSIPDKARQQILIFRQHPNGKDVIVFGIEDSFDSFGAGQIVFANHTRLPTALSLGNQQPLPVSPGEIKSIQIPDMGGKKSQVFNLTIARLEAEGWQKSLDSNIRFRPTLRYVYVGTDTGMMGTFYLWSIQEFVKRSEQMLAQAKSGETPVVRERPVASLRTTPEREIRLISWREDARLQVRAGGEPLTLEVRQDRPTEPVRYIGNQTVTLHAPNAAAGDRQEGYAQIPEDWQRVLLLVLPQGAGAENRYRTLPLRDDWQSFPENSIRIINITPHLLGGFVGSESFRLETLEHQILPITSGASLNVAYYENDQWQRGLQQAQQLTPGTRLTAIIVPDFSAPGEGKLRAVIYHDKEGD